MIKVTRDGEEVRFDGLLANRPRTGPGANERLGGNVVSQSRIIAKKQREAMHAICIALVETVEVGRAVSASLDMPEQRKGYSSLVG